MKKRIPAFISGMVTMAVLLLLVVGVMAASGMTITVNPINVQVNGEVFKPKDVNGKDVPVFNYCGTTYAPLRAMAEAFGLEVGYHAEKKMAIGEKGIATTPIKPTTPDKPTSDYSNWTAEEEKAYQEFKGMWDVTLQTNIADGKPYYEPAYNGKLPLADIEPQKDTWRNNGFLKRFCAEYINTQPDMNIMYFLFVYHTTNGDQDAVITFYEAIV